MTILDSKLRELLVRDIGHAEDNLARAKAAFKGMDMSAQHGQSGKTRGEVLAEYQEWYDEKKGDLAAFDAAQKTEKR